MVIPTVPAWLRILLLILSFISFFPQLRLLWSRRDSSGISLYYVLFNLISATELFTLSFFFLINDAEESDVFVNHPPNAGDWLNLVQLGLVWVLWLLIFVACLYYPSDHSRPSLRTTVRAIYVSFLFISVIPVFIDAITSRKDEQYHKWATALFHSVHSLFFNPIITILGISSLFFQARETMSRPEGPAALSVVGLAFQAVVFAVVALVWPARLVFPWHELGGRVTIGLLITWYQLVGFVAVDNAVFALVQAVLLWLIMRHGHGGSPEVDSGETEPLVRR